MAGEAKLEDRCRNYVKPTPSYRFKFSGVRGGQDCVFFPKDKQALWVEFKNPNGKGAVHPLQQAIHNQLRAYGHKVHVVKTFEQFKVVWNAHTE